MGDSTVLNQSVTEGSATSATLSNLLKGTRYRVSIRAENSGGESEQSNDIEARTGVDGELRVSRFSWCDSNVIFN